jgi:hypothetical protein
VCVCVCVLLRTELLHLLLLQRYVFISAVTFAAQEIAHYFSATFYKTSSCIFNRNLMEGFQRGGYR